MVESWYFLLTWIIQNIYVQSFFSPKDVHVSPIKKQIWLCAEWPAASSFN